MNICIWSCRSISFRIQSVNDFHQKFHLCFGKSIQDGVELWFGNRLEIGAHTSLILVICKEIGRAHV